MKERPILFNADMVRAILAGTKTQTRRIVKAEFHHACTRFERAPFKGYGREGHWVQMTADEQTQRGLCRDVFGVPGDRLWVKETWAVQKDLNRTKPRNLPRPLNAPFWYRATDDTAFDGSKLNIPRGHWRPSLFMRRWMSRLVLVITHVRVERLQDISEADALAEGIIKQTITVGRTRGHPDYDMFALGPGDHCEWECTAREVYRKLWEQINGPGTWGVNPWVWVVGFRRVTS